MLGGKQSFSRNARAVRPGPDGEKCQKHKHRHSHAVRYIDTVNDTENGLRHKGRELKKRPQAVLLTAPDGLG